MRLHRQAGSSEPLLHTYMISETQWLGYALVKFIHVHFTISEGMLKVVMKWLLVPFS